MVRNYKRKLGARTFKDYSEDKLKEALEAVKSGQMSQSGASKQFKISRGTIQNKLQNKHQGSNGRPLAFTPIEELSLVAHLKAISNYGFPVCRDELKIIAKGFLDKKGVQHKQFKNNYPGDDWVSSFLSRHKGSIGLRKASNINSRRFEITRAEMQEYANNMKVSLEGVPPENIVNYDETAMSDDPGRKKMIFQKGRKYAEVNVNSTKSNITVMFAASGSGQLLPPYIIYKAKNIYESWTQNGPVNARYSSTSHGWFEGISFLDWFKKIIVPYRRNHHGKFAIIGDNLASHISQEVIDIANEHDILLVFLPPNSTHISQPLDVSVFRSLKSKWREVLSIWKKDNPKKLSLEKTIFPNLLKLTLDGITNMESNILSGFKSTGICPLDDSHLLKKFNIDPEFNPEILSETFIEHLTQTKSSIVPKKKRGKKFNVIPGTSVGHNVEDNNMQVDANSEVSGGEEMISEENAIETPRLVLVSQDFIDLNDQDLIGSFILVKYSTEKNRNLHYIGLAQNIGSKLNTIVVKFLRKNTETGKELFFTEPYIEDISEIEVSQVVSKLPQPKIFRGRHTFDFCFDNTENIL